MNIPPTTQAPPTTPTPSTPLVNFVGAGPGAEDLITVRGLKLLQEADLVLFAGSLVNPEHLKQCKSVCECLDTASMNLGEQIDAMSKAALLGKRVVRLHTGDPAIYGAINEQIRGLAECKVASHIVAGVSSVFGAAAALGCELTCPDVSQTVVLTRTPGRTPMPASEKASTYAQTGATLVFFLSTGNVDTLMQNLMDEGNLTPDTPVAVVYRVSWPDERILRGTLADMALKVEEAGFGRQALIFVGWALAANGSASRLYDANFSHGYRNHLPNEFFEGSCALYAFTDKGLVRAKEIAAGLGVPVTIYTTRASSQKSMNEGVDSITPLPVHITGEALSSHFAAHWQHFAAHIFISATGIAVRKIAPLLHDKSVDPAVVVCSESGAHIISLTSGHLGGANRLSRRIARITGGQAVISTATDVHGHVAFDELAAKENARILNKEGIKALNAALLAHEDISFCGPRDLFEQAFATNKHVIYVDKPEDITTKYAVLWDCDGLVSNGLVADSVQYLAITTKAFVLGIGCRRGVDPVELQNTVQAHLQSLGLREEQVAAIASCDVKADEAAILELAKKFNVPLDFYTVKELDLVPVPTPSAKVHEKIGTGSVCEAASLLSAGYTATCKPNLYAQKTRFEGMTLAVARLPHLANEHEKHGKVIVVGLGSGMPCQITPEVHDALRQCDIVAGYDKYVDFIRDRIIGKPVIQNGMMGELARCKATLEAAATGQTVCMVCSGDPGILAMAGLLFELRAREAAFTSIPIRVLPGITAANIAAASLGAPLQNGFSLVSLSDLLVPADEIRQNLQAVAKSALPVVLYNPAGRKRRQLLTEALEIFLKHRGGDILCAYVRHAGRPQEEKWIGTLAAFPADRVDMSTLIVIGSERTILNDDTLYEARGYVDKYLEGDPA